jgi:hypothetical protein
VAAKARVRSGLPFCFSRFPPPARLGQHVGGDQEAEQENQGRRDEKLRREDRAVVVVNLGPGGAAHRAATLDYRAGTVSADQVLAAHLKSLPAAVPRAHLARSGALAASFPLDCSLAQPGYPQVARLSRKDPCVAAGPGQTRSSVSHASPAIPGGSPSSRDPVMVP